MAEGEGEALRIAVRRKQPGPFRAVSNGRAAPQSSNNPPRRSQRLRSASSRGNRTRDREPRTRQTSRANNQQTNGPETQMYTATQLYHGDARLRYGENSLQSLHSPRSTRSPQPQTSPYSLQRAAEQFHARMPRINILIQPPRVASPRTALYPVPSLRVQQGSSNTSNYDRVNLSMYFACCSLVNPDGSELVTSQQPAALTGTAVASAQTTLGGESAYYVFPNLAISQPGQYRIRISLLEMEFDPERGTQFGTNVGNVETNVVHVREEAPPDLSAVACKSWICFKVDCSRLLTSLLQRLETFRSCAGLPKTVFCGPFRRTDFLIHPKRTMSRSFSLVDTSGWYNSLCELASRPCFG